jgi:hypothetical protein
MDKFLRDLELLIFCYVFFFVGDYYDVLEGESTVTKKGMTIQIYLRQTKLICFCLSLSVNFYKQI